MIIVTVAGNVGKNADLRNAGGSQVLNFSVAGTTGFGDRQQTVWFNCAIWGKRGESLAQHILKGDRVTVIGELSFREYEGKQYQEINVMDIKLQGGGTGASQSAESEKPVAQPTNDGSLDFDDDVPF